MERNKLISYAMDLASYLVLKVSDIDRILLYGSVASGDFNEKSDVDLFVDINEKGRNKIDKVLEDYYKTKKYKEWQLKGIKNEFSVISGRLNSNEWADLRRAMNANGLILYGGFRDKAEKISSYALFVFENAKPEKKRVSVFRSLFGFKTGKKEYNGLVGKLNGKRIGKGIILVDSTKARELNKFFNDKKIRFNLYDFWSDVKY